MNHYEILEVSPNASAAVIKAAYKSLMQRYHPDKNPGDAALAERASRVVQAYEILSDSTKRSAYDRELKAASPAGRPPRGADTRRRSVSPASRPGSVDQDGPRVWAWLAMIGVLIASIWAMAEFSARLLTMGGGDTASARNSVAAPRASRGDKNGSQGREAFEAVSGRASANEQIAARPAPGAVTLARLVTDLAVTLHSAGGRSQDGRILTIPVLGVKLGARDSEYAARHLQNTVKQIRKRLEDELAQASIDELTGPGREQYLAELVLATIAQDFDAANPADDSPPPARGNAYGVVEVFFPESFSLR